MKNIFEKDDFSKYKASDFQIFESRNQSKDFTAGVRQTPKTTVFVSHKHSDLDNLKYILGFLKSNYNVEVYIDSRDPNMPKETCGDTAKRIKEIIRKCDRFILLATNDAIESKWCNWELGFGDALKYRDKIALFPFKDNGMSDNQYKGNEYMQIYPYIVKYDGCEKYSNGTIIKSDYYVCYSDNGQKTITPLSDWLKK